MEQILRNTAATITQTWYVNGTATDVGDVTVTVTGQDGTVIDEDAATTNNEDGTYDYDLDAQPNLDILTLVFTDVDSGDTLVNTVEIVGGYLFTEAEVRAFSFEGKTLDEATYPDSVVTTARADITDKIARQTGISWIPRYAREKHTGTGGRVLRLDHRQVNTILSATIDGTAVDVADLVVDTAKGKVFHTTGTWTPATWTNPLNVIIEYEFGYEYLRDGVSRAAMLWVIDELRRSNVPLQATTMQTDDTFYRFDTSGPSRVPEVNQWLKDNDRTLGVL